tara:strand:+ start:1000 stop:1218 length:219 start_codon:yes stop_codon:yes gene_type:complete
MNSSSSQQKENGKEVVKLAHTFGSYDLMNEDNKKMLEKVGQAKTNDEVIKALLTDPDTGRTMSYAESRMRFG